MDAPPGPPGRLVWLDHSQEMGRSDGHRQSARSCTACGANYSSAAAKGPEYEQTLCLGYALLLVSGTSLTRTLSCLERVAAVDRQRQDPNWSRKRVSIMSLISDAEEDPRRTPPAPSTPILKSVSTDAVFRRPTSPPSAAPSPILPTAAGVEKKKRRKNFGGDAERWRIVPVFKEHKASALRKTSM